MIDPNNIDTIRVGQLVEAVFSGTDNIPHEVGTDLRRGTIADLAAYIAGVIDTTGGLAFLPIAVTDGQTLPATTTNEWFLAGEGTYLQSEGYPNIVCTEKLSVIIGNGTFWSLGVSIPITVDPPAAMISQSVNAGVTNYSPSEDAVRTAIDDATFLNAFGSFNYNDAGTFTTPISVTANIEAKLTNDTLGIYTDVSQAPFGVSSIWNQIANQFDFSQLSIGDWVELRTDILLDLIGTNTSYQLYMKMAIGSGATWTLNIHNGERKSTDQFNDVHFFGFVVGNTQTRDYPAELWILTDAGATVKVNGFLAAITRKNINIATIEVGDVQLNDLIDVDVPLPQIGQALLYDGTKWISGQQTVAVDEIPTDGSLNAVSSNGVFDALASKAEIQGTILYHSAKWFTPTGTVSNVGTTVTSVGTQFTAVMVGARLTINGEHRIVQSYTSTSQVVVDVAYSVNNSGVLAANWGIYSRSYVAKISGSFDYQTTRLYDRLGQTMIGIDDNLVRVETIGQQSTNSLQLYAPGLQLGGSRRLTWTNSTSGINEVGGTNDIGLRRNAAGILEIYDGVTATGVEANRRDLVLRNLTMSTPTTSAGTYDILTRNSSTGVVEKVGSSTFGLPPHLEFNNTNKTIWNKGNGGFDNNLSFGQGAFANYTGGGDDGNTALGNYALEASTNGSINTAVGANALRFNITGGYNTGVGAVAGVYTSSGTNNTISNHSIFLGYYTRPLADNETNQIVIGNSAVGNGSNTATLGNNDITETYLKGKVITNNVVRLKNYTVATLPTGTEGDTAYVTDALAPTYLGALTGGGSVVCPVFFNGTIWVSH